MTENHKDPLSRAEFFRRLSWSFVLSFAIFTLWLLIGVCGYHSFADISWLDAFHQAALVFSGVGSTNTLQTPAGKIFESLYAMIGALIIFILVTILLAPVVHRFMHKFHIGK